MRKHIKYILAVILICSMVFTACGQTSNTDSSENPSASETPEPTIAPDGSNWVELYKSDKYIETGLYVFGNRIYARGEYELIVVNLNDGTAYLHEIY